MEFNQLTNMDRLFEIETAVDQDPLPVIDRAANERDDPTFQTIQLRESEDLEAEAFLIPIGR